VTTVSVDREVLGQQIEEQQTLAVDMENRRPRVHALTESCLPQDRAAVDELLDRFDVLQTRCEERGKVLDSVVSRLTELQTGVKQVDTWIGATLNALKHDRSADRDPHSVKNRVEGFSLLLSTLSFCCCCCYYCYYFQRLFKRHTFCQMQFSCPTNCLSVLKGIFMLL